MEVTEVDFNLNKKNLAIIKKLVSLDTEYVDFYILGDKCLVLTETKGLEFAGLISLQRGYEDIKFRISSQVLKQVDAEYTLMRIKISADSICVELYFSDNMKPVKINVLNSRVSLRDMEAVSKLLLRKTISDNNSFIDSIPSIVGVGSIVKGLNNRDLLISNGIVFLDNPEYKFFSDLGCRTMNVIVPDIIVKQLKYEVGSKDRDFLIESGMCRFRSGDFLYSWKLPRVMQVQEYEIMKNMKPVCRASVSFGKLLSFLGKLSVSKNRNQILKLDFDRGIALVEENGIMNYEIPFYSSVVMGACPQAVSVDIKALQSVTKSIESGAILVDIHPKFLSINSTVEVGDSGLLATFLLRRVR